MSVTDKAITNTWYCCSLQISSCHSPPPSTHTTPKKRIATSCWTVVHIACSQRRSSLKLTAYLSKWTRLVDEVKHLPRPFFSPASLKGWQTELGQKSRWPLDLRFARKPHICSSLFGCDIFSLVHKCYLGCKFYCSPPLTWCFSSKKFCYIYCQVKQLK